MTSSTVADPFEQFVQRRERIEKIKQALLAMSPREQLVLIAHDGQSKPLDRIAQALRISDSEAVRVLISARTRLEDAEGF